MITIHDLLEDPIYRKYFQTPPKVLNRGRFRLNLLDNRDGKWKKKDCDTYKEAFKAFRAFYKAGRIKDAAITSLGQSYAPPLRWVKIKGKYVTGSDGKQRQAMKRVEWKPKLDISDEFHRWCPWCRRPVVIKYYSRHHSLKGMISIDTQVQRCTICGASERVLGYISEA